MGSSHRAAFASKIITVGPVWRGIFQDPCNRHRMPCNLWRDDAAYAGAEVLDSFREACCPPALAHTAFLLRAGRAGGMSGGGRRPMRAPASASLALESGRSSCCLSVDPALARPLVKCRPLGPWTCHQHLQRHLSFDGPNHRRAMTGLSCDSVSLWRHIYPLPAIGGQIFADLAATTILRPYRER